MLVLLDLSPAFDTVSHQILFRHMESDFGVTGHLLSWFSSYLIEREHFIVINGFKSNGLNLEHGVLQESVLGPKLFSICTRHWGKSLGSVIFNTAYVPSGILCHAIYAK